MARYLPYEENEINDDYLDSDEDNIVCCSSRYVISSSSDEDAEKFLEKLRSKRLVKKVQVLDKRDDFEREMDSELSLTLQQLRASFSKKAVPDTTASASQSNASATLNDEESKEFYDEIYFDSDDSDSEELTHKPSGSDRGKGKRRILSNDELFYDPKMDDRDQAWVDKMRRSYQVKNKKRSPGSPKVSKDAETLPESDAVLNCPACLTMLCMDCQRHEIYHTQYRAMFVFNCKVNSTEVLKFPKKTQKNKEYFRNKKKAKKAQKQGEETTESQQKDAQMDTNSKKAQEQGEETTENQQKNAQMDANSKKAQEQGEETTESQQKDAQMDTNSKKAQEQGEETTENQQKDAQMDANSKKAQEQGEETTESQQKDAQMDTNSKKAQEQGEETTERQQKEAQMDTNSSDKSEEVLSPQKENTTLVVDGTSKIQLSGQELEASVSSNNSGESSLESNSDELFHPVLCKICNTKVAIYDKDEVYHFFNIVTSY